MNKTWIFNLSGIEVNIVADTELLNLYSLDSVQILSSISPFVLEVDDEGKEKTVIVDGDNELAYLFRIENNMYTITYVLRDIIDFEDIYLVKKLRSTTMTEVFDNSCGDWSYIKAWGKY